MSKIALVTGAGRRIGAALALGLAKEGWDIHLHFHTSRKEAGDVQKAIQALGRKCHLLQADLSLGNGGTILWDQVLELGQPVDLLVAGASSYNEIGWENLSLEEWENSQKIEAWAPFVLARYLVAQKRPGAQGIFLLDTRFKDYDKKHLSYHLGKRQLFDFFRVMAWEGAPAVRFNAIAPGLVLKPQSMDPVLWDSLKSSNPLQTLGAPEDVVKALLFLISSPFVTGQVIYVDGGRHLKGEFYGA